MICFSASVKYSSLHMTNIEKQPFSWDHPKYTLASFPHHRQNIHSSRCCKLRFLFAVGIHRNRCHFLWEKSLWGIIHSNFIFLCTHPVQNNITLVWVVIIYFAEYRFHFATGFPWQMPEFPVGKITAKHEVSKVQYRPWVSSQSVKCCFICFEIQMIYLREICFCWDENVFVSTVGLFACLHGIAFILFVTVNIYLHVYIFQVISCQWAHMYGCLIDSSNCCK